MARNQHPKHNIHHHSYNKLELTHNINRYVRQPHHHCHQHNRYVLSFWISKSQWHRKALTDGRDPAGNQGNSVANSLLKNPGLTVRGTARDLNSAKAQELASRGLVIFHVDFGVLGEQLDVALAGAWGLFLNIDSSSPAVKGQEFEITTRIVDAAEKAGIPHIVYSTIASAAEATDGAISLLSFDGELPSKRRRPCAVG